MKTGLLKNWTAWRLVRMLFAIVFIGIGCYRYDTVLILGGVFLAVHALVNACATCQTGGCHVEIGREKGK